MATVRSALCSAFLVLSLAPAAAQQPPTASRRVVLRDLVPAGDPLAAQDLGFDASFAEQAVGYVATGDATILPRLAASPAIAHVLAHARNFDYDVPKDSAAALVAALLGPPDRAPARAEACRRAIACFDGPMLADPTWVGDSLRYLPEGFRFHGTLFLTFGYDIGVALAPNASLNCTHAHFAGGSRELLYYAIHELHHVGFMTYHPPPRVADIATCADLLRLVEYSTELEGTAVLAAYQRRRDESALGSDADYAALDDGPRMQADLDAYLADRAYLARRGVEPVDGDAWKVVERMSSGERLWYRVGATMARRIEAARGRAALVALVERGPAAFLSAFLALPSPGRPAPE